MGEEQARAVLRDLMKAPATATHIATKLATSPLRAVLKDGWGVKPVTGLLRT